MSKKRARKPVKSNKTADLTYEKALEMVRLARGRSRLYSPVSIISYPECPLPINPATRAKLVTVTNTMLAIGRLPGDFPANKFDSQIHYRKLDQKTIS